MTAPAPRPPSARRFTLLDGMILVASVAAGLGVLRAFSGEGEWDFLVTPSLWSRDLLDVLAADLIVMLAPPAVSVTLAVLALRLRQPRPTWRRLVRQPGLMAGLALVAAWAVVGIFTALHVTSLGGVVVLANGGGVGPGDSPGYWLEVFSEFAAVFGGFAVASCWATLAVGRRWRAEAGWGDRLGRLVGVGWIAMALAVAYEWRRGY